MTRCVGPPPWPDPLLLLDLSALVALAGPTLRRADVRGVLEQQFLLLQSLDELGPAVATGSWERAGTAVNTRFLRIGMTIS